MDKPITINGRIINNFEEFQKFFLQNRSKKEKAIEFLKKKLDSLEKRYQMSTQEFINTIVGTPAEDTPDFIQWAILHNSLHKLLNKK